MGGCCECVVKGRVMATESDGGRDLAAKIGAEVRRQRKHQDMTTAMLADAAGLSQGMLSKIETGHTSPSLSTLSSLADALAVPVSSFFSASEKSREKKKENKEPDKRKQERERR